MDWRGPSGRPLAKAALSNISVQTVHTDSPLVAPGNHMGGPRPEFEVIPPWDWYPRQLPHWGLRASTDEAPRLWFCGKPQGQQRGVWDTVVFAIARRQRLISFLTAETIKMVSRPVNLAVLTTPG